MTDRQRLFGNDVAIGMRHKCLRRDGSPGMYTEIGVDATEDFFPAAKMCCGRTLYYRMSLAAPVYEIL